MCVGFSQSESSGVFLSIRQFLNWIFPMLAGHHVSHDQALVIPVVLLAGVVLCPPGYGKATKRMNLMSNTVKTHHLKN